MRSENPPHFTETKLLVPGLEQGSDLGTGPFAFLRRRAINLIASPLTVITFSLGAVATAVPRDSIELALRNTEIVMGQVPQLDFHGNTATEAASKTEQAFGLGNGYYIDDLSKVSGEATTWHQYQLLTMFDLIDTLYPGQGYDQKLNQALNASNTSYWDNSPAGYPAGYNASRTFAFITPERYVDDNLWMAQFLMHQYQNTGDQTYLDRVKEIMDLFISQQDPEGGGTYWKVQLPAESDHGRVMASNATAIPTLVEMYVLNDNASYLMAAENTFAWVQQLRDPITGLYFDNFMANGEIETSIYTYNQAEVIGAMVGLNKIDPVRYPLSDAISLAKTSMDYFASHNGYGIRKFDVQYFITLAQLGSIVNDPSLTAQIQQNIVLGKDAPQNSLDSLANAAAAAAILALSEMPVSSWSKL